MADPRPSPTPPSGYRFLAGMLLLLGLTTLALSLRGFGSEPVTVETIFDGVERELPPEMIGEFRTLRQSPDFRAQIQAQADSLALAGTGWVTGAQGLFGLLYALAGAGLWARREWARRGTIALLLLTPLAYLLIGIFFIPTVGRSLRGLYGTSPGIDIGLLLWAAWGVGILLVLIFHALVVYGLTRPAVRAYTRRQPEDAP